MRNTPYEFLDQKNFKIKKCYYCKGFFVDKTFRKDKIFCDGDCSIKFRKEKMEIKERKGDEFRVMALARQMS